VRSAAGYEGFEGALLGMAGAFSAMGLLRRLLYGVTPFDGATVAAVAAVVGLAVLGAVIRPAWRAAQVDPNTALRAE
jgi:putative ABC transport system permease protein